MSSIARSRVKSSLLAAGFSGALLLGIMVGCSAGGDADGVEQPTPDSGNTVLGDQDGDVDTPDEDGGNKPKDAGKKETGVDSGPPAPAEGSPCPTVDLEATRTCGRCGKQKSLCIANPEGGGNIWDKYGACTDEKGECVPGDVLTATCGNCGTRTVTCNNVCAFPAGTCATQGVCAPGQIELTNGGCDPSTTFKRKTCLGTCQFDGNFSAACTAAPTTIEVGPTPKTGTHNGSVTWSVVSLSASSPTVAKLTGTCGGTMTYTAATQVPYQYFQVHNGNAKTAVVSIYNSKYDTNAVFDTALIAYSGAGTPANNETARKNCVKGAKISGTSALTGDVRFASLDGTASGVEIPAGGTVTILNAGENATSYGQAKFNVRLEELKD